MDLDDGYLMALDAMNKFFKMKIDKKLIKELVENLKEFSLTELEYQEGQTKIKVSRALKELKRQKLRMQLFLKIKLF